MEYKNEKVNKLMDKPPISTPRVIVVNFGALNNKRNAYFISINIDIMITPQPIQPV